MLQGAGYEIIPAPLSGSLSVPFATTPSWGAWTQAVGSLSYDNMLAGLSLGSLVSFYDYDIQVGIGAAGSEQVVSSFRVHAPPSSAAWPIFFPPIPVFLPAGSRVSLRCSAGATGNITATLIVVQCANMADAPQRLVLAQLVPSASWMTTLYTASTLNNIGSIRVNNQNDTPVSITVTYAPAGAVDSQEQHLFEQQSIAAQAVLELPIGVAPSSTSDVVRVKTTAGNVSCELLGAPQGAFMLAQHLIAAANTAEDLYTLPAYTNVGRADVVNPYAYPISVSVAYAPAGAADDPKQYHYTNRQVGPFATMPLPLGLRGGAAGTDKVRVKANAAGVGFQLRSA